MGRSVGEGLSVLTAGPGSVALELRCGPMSKAGVVSVSVAERRRASLGDRQRVRAERLFQRAEEGRLLNEHLREILEHGDPSF